MDDSALERLLAKTAEAVASAFETDRAARLADPRTPGVRPGQFRLDLIADDAAMDVLQSGGVSVLSEESGFTDRGSEVIVVIDPIDGSTNASRGLPWYATSLCAVDDKGLREALVVNIATTRRYRARRGGGAFCDGVPIVPSGALDLGSSMLVLNGFDPGFTDWLQYRSLGATALDLCSVADGTVDASVDFSGALGPWDYLGAALILSEAGAVIEDAYGRELLELGHEVRRAPVAAGNGDLLAQILEARRTSGLRPVSE